MAAIALVGILKIGKEELSRKNPISGTYKNGQSNIKV
jgi:hypothetical protein